MTAQHDTTLRFGPLPDAAITPMQHAIRAISGREVSIEALQARVKASGHWNDHGAEYGAWQDEHPVGVVQAAICPVRNQPGFLELGILIFDSSDRGRGLGSRVLAGWRDHLFAEQSAYRLWFTTHEENIAMRRIGERAGFHLEGVLRGFHKVDGELVDAVIYGMTEDDWHARQSRDP